MNIENINYWNDRRVRAGMIDSGKFVKEGDQVYIVVESENDEGEIDDIKVQAKWGVCDLCEGNGTHVNPSIDAGGISAEEFYDDPDFAEDYFNGAYDQTCNQCNGLRVVPVVDEDRSDPEMIQRYYDYLKEEYDYAAMYAAERAMGA